MLFSRVKHYFEYCFYPSQITDKIFNSNQQKLKSQKMAILINDAG